VSGRPDRSSTSAARHSIGIASRYPWPSRQPISISAARCSSVSMPSATTLTSITRAKSMMISANFRPCGSLMASTKALSILSTSMGSSRR
jgi:hypothetical protein